MLAGAGDSRAARDGSCPSTAGVEGRKGLLETKDVYMYVYIYIQFLYKRLVPPFVYCLLFSSSLCCVFVDT